MSRVWYPHDDDISATTYVYERKEPERPAATGPDGAGAGDAKKERGTGPYGGEGVASDSYDVDDPPPVRFEHDPAARVFRLTTADGTVEVFRDNPTGYLCVEPDSESDTGAMRPVTRRGRPVYLYLCREERDAGAAKSCL
jgi:hypothetical protein